MRTPSSKTLRFIYGDKAKEAKALLKANRADLLKNEAADKMRRACYSTVRNFELRLCALNALGEFYGVETISAVNGERADYLNAGEMYTPTLIRWRGNYRVQSIGDFIETLERQGVRFS